MNDAGLRRVALWIAVLAAGVAVAGMLAPPLRQLVAGPAALITASLAALLFLRMLFSREYHAAIDEANREIQGEDPWPGRAKPIFDERWGLFGSLAGNRMLLWVRAILVLGLLPVALVEPWVGREVVYLWLAASFVVMELSLMHLAERSVT